jgi:hypothetical protein
VALVAGAAVVVLAVSAIAATTVTADIAAAFFNTSVASNDFNPGDRVICFLRFLHLGRCWSLLFVDLCGEIFMAY